MNLLPVNDCDTISEISDTASITSESSWGSKEELYDFFTRHGLRDIDDLYQERFRVDRRRLQEMINGGNETLLPVDVFFAKIMEDSDTYIIWPNTLKLGAKSKGNPQIKVAGKQENVLFAKERILAVLATRSNRVTMKMDISYTDHSHMIGRDGLSIKRVMDESQCHVHFPDSNRSNLTEKSNQVSISGDLERVEMARSRLRELIPLVFGFELPITEETIDKTTPFVIEVQEKFQVQVIFRTRSKLHATIVFVKGPEWDLENVKRATILLMEYMFRSSNVQVPVEMTIQISPQNHLNVFGKNLIQLKTIMQYTNTKILVPDRQDQNISNLKKSNICISGNINDVYRARQLLIGSLPLLIIFELPEDSIELRIRPEDLIEIQNSCDVSITVRQKNRQTMRACIIKGIERNATKIYKARNMILGINEPPITANIPDVYHLPTNSAQLTEDFLSPSMVFSPIYGWQLLQQPQIPKVSYNMAASTASSGFFSDTTGSSPDRQYREYKLFPEHVPKSPLYSFLPPDHQLDEKFDQTDVGDLYDYEARRLASLKAMQTYPNPNVYRTPNNFWSVKSTDALILNEDIWKCCSLPNYFNNSYNNSPTNLNTSNILDNSPIQLVERIKKGKWDDLPSLLISLDLDRYMALFVQNKVDLETFATFNEKDLITIGVNAFGSRRKMLLAIAELNRRSTVFALAPGAERRNSKSTPTSSQEGSPNW